MSNNYLMLNYPAQQLLVKLYEYVFVMGMDDLVRYGSA
jgi:hypothetical protein